MIRANRIEQIIDIIKQPIITDKTTKNIENNVYSFSVKAKSNKKEIKKAIEYVFDVKVKKVNTMNFAPKMKTIGKFKGKKTRDKKAMVTLHEDNTINLFEEN